MKKLETLGIITSTVRMPIKQGTWDFLQQSYQEVLAAIMQHTVGPDYDTTKVYVLYGCVQSAGGGGSTNISAGAIFFNGEVYLSSAQTVAATSFPNVIIANVIKTQYTTNADPVTFTDSSTHNVHNIYKVRYINGTSGSGDFDDFGNFIYLPAINAFSSSGLVLQSGWANVGSPSYDATFKISEGNECRMSGYITHSGSMTTGAVNVIQLPFTLPIDVSGILNIDHGTIKSVPWNITTGGMLSINPLATISGVNLSLEGFSFRIA